MKLSLHRVIKGISVRARIILLAAIPVAGFLSVSWRHWREYREIERLVRRAPGPRISAPETKNGS